MNLEMILRYDLSHEKAMVLETVSGTLGFLVRCAGNDGLGAINIRVDAMNLTKILFTIGQSVLVYFIVLGFFTVGKWFYEDIKNGY